MYFSLLSLHSSLFTNMAGRLFQIRDKREERKVEVSASPMDFKSRLRRLPLSRLDFFKSSEPTTLFLRHIVESFQTTLTQSAIMKGCFKDGQLFDNLAARFFDVLGDSQVPEPCRRSGFNAGNSPFRACLHQKGGEIEDVRAWLLSVMTRRYYDMLRRKYRLPTVAIGGGLRHP